MQSRNDYRTNPIADRFGLPAQDFTTPNINDVIVVEEFPLPVGNASVIYGTPRPGDTAKLLVDQKYISKGGTNERNVRRIYAAPRSAQDFYNAAYKYTSEDNSSQVFVRVYFELRSTYTARTKGNPLDTIIKLALTAGGTGYTRSNVTVSFSGGGGTGATAVAEVQNGAVVSLQITNGGSGYTSAPTVSIGGGTGATATASIQAQACILVAEEAVAADGDLRSLFLKVTRVYMTLPGPVLTAWKIDGETQTPVRVDTQLVSKASGSYDTTAPVQVSVSNGLAGSAGTITFTAQAQDGDTFALTTPNGTTTTFEMDNNHVVGVASSGTITFYANPTAGTITLTTHDNAVHIFEFVNGAATSGSTQVSIGATKEMTAMNFAAAVNNNGNFTCTMPGDTSVSITRVATGASNQTITFTGTPAQVETATAAGTVDAGGGTITITTTIALNNYVSTFTLTANHTATQWAGTVRASGSWHATVTANYTVGGSGTAITLTAKTGVGHDTTLNMNIADVDASITAAPTSANTTAGCIAKTNFSGGATESGLTSGNTAVTIGANENASATALAAAFTASGYFTTSVNTAGAHPIITVTRVAYGAGSLTITITGGRATTTNFSGGSNLPATVEYEPLSSVHGQLTTVYLSDFANISRTEYSDFDYPYPRIITGVFTTALEMDGGQVKVTTHVVARSGQSSTKQATTTITYNTFGNLSYSAPFDPALVDVIYDGWFINLRETNVWLDPNVAIRFNTNSNNPIYGYVGETFVQAGQGTFPTGTKTISCRIRPWKYGLHRKEVTTVEL